MTTLSIDAIDYLNSLQGKVPNARVGLGYDGQRLGLVCFSIVQNPDPEVRNDAGEREKCAFVWYADEYDGIGSQNVFRLLDQILALATGLESTQIDVVGRGLHRVAWSFAQEAKRKHGVKIKEFEKRACGRWQPEEVVSAVIDDLYEERIRPAPEFRGRPEFEILNSTLRNFRLTNELDPLSEAAFYGLGYWSALQLRPKWKLGPSGFRIW